jgi:hypothetical protein
LADLSRVTLTDVITFERACGVDYYQARAAMASLVDAFRQGLLDGDDPSELRRSVLGNLNLGSVLLWLLWVCRHGGGDRQPNGSPLTVDQAGDVVTDDITFVLDPGDRKPVVEDRPPDPQLARSGSVRAVSGKPKRRTGTKTSTAQS